MIKAVVPHMALKIVDRAIQTHGGAGVCQDFPLANFWIVARMLKSPTDLTKFISNRLRKWN